MTDRTPLERFERFPEPLQAALVELALSAIDTTREEKEDMLYVLNRANTDALPEALRRTMTAHRDVLAAVWQNITEGIISDLLADDAQLLREAMREENPDD